MKRNFWCQRGAHGSSADQLCGSQQTHQYCTHQLISAWRWRAQLPVGYREQGGKALAEGKVLLTRMRASGTPMLWWVPAALLSSLGSCRAAPCQQFPHTSPPALGAPGVICLHANLQGLNTQPLCPRHLLAALTVPRAPATRPCCSAWRAPRCRTETRIRHQRMPILRCC